MDTVANILFVAIILGMIWITLSNKFGKDTPVNLGKIPVKGSVDQNYPYHDPSWDDKPNAGNAGNIYTTASSSTNKVMNEKEQAMARATQRMEDIAHNGARVHGGNVPNETLSRFFGRAWFDVNYDKPHGLTEKEIRQRTGHPSKIISDTVVRIFE